MLSLRGFHKHDLARLYELDQACFPPEIAYSVQELLYFLSRPDCFCRIAEEIHAGEEIGRPSRLGQLSLSDKSDKSNRRAALAGFIIVERLRRTTPASGTIGHVITIDVSHAQRRQGVGSLLMRAAETQLKEDGACGMSLEVAENNDAAIEFYRRHGFSITARIANYYYGNVDARVMEKTFF